MNRFNLQGVIPEDWTGEYCRFAVCWPNSPRWLAILRRVLVLPSEGRFWQETTGNIKATQQIIRKTFNTNLHLEECIMSCSDEGLSRIASAIVMLANAQCCTSIPGGTGGIQVVVELPGGGQAPLYGSEPPATIPIGTVPDEFDGSYSEYKQAQCDVAHQLVSNWEATLRGLGYINFAQTNGLIVVILGALVGLIVLPEFMIPALIAAALLSVLTQEMWFALADGLEAHRDDIVCAIIQNDTVIEIYTAIANVVETVITELGLSSIQGAALKLAALILVNTNTLNKLLNLSQPASPSSECNCDICSQCLDRIDGSGNVIANLDAPITEWLTLSSEFSQGGWNVFIDVGTGIWLIEWQDLVGWTPLTSPPFYDFNLGQSTVGDVIVSSDFETFSAASALTCISPPATHIGQWGIRSGTAFTVDIKVTACN